MLASCGDDAHVALSEQAPAAAADAPATLTAALVVASTAALPACTAALAGTTAFVTQGPQLYTCARGNWLREACTVDRAGEVAFVTGERFLLACSAKVWTRVELPSNGRDGLSSLVASSQEPPGAQCAAGGVRIDTGLDTDLDGTLDSTEVTSSAYACGGNSTAPLASVVGDAPSCRAGGKALNLYQDTNGNGALDSGEAVGEPVVVCNGDAAQANGSTPIVKAFRSADLLGVVAGEGANGTGLVLSASISVPSAGTVLALGSSVGFCASASGGYAGQGFGECAPTAGDTAAWLTVVDATSSSQAGNSGQAIVVTGLRPDADTQLSLTAVFNVLAGTHSFNLLGMASDSTPAVAGTSVYYGASELTLVFVPSR